METRTEAIARELLNAALDPGGLPAVLRRHSRSKGPLYLALAEATAEMTSRLEKISEETGEAKRQRDQLTGEKARLQEESELLEASVRELDEQVQQQETSLAQVQGLLDQAARLQERGFGGAELDRLYNLLSHFSASQGAAPEEGVAQFFETVGRFERIVTMDLEAKRAETRAATAKAEAERWEAEARKIEAQTKARSASIDITKKLMARGVKADDLVDWHKVVSKAGSTPEDLALGIEKYASVEALTREREERAVAFERQIARRRAELRVLTDQRDGVRKAIETLRDTGLAEVQRAGRQTVFEIKGAGQAALEYIRGLGKTAVELGRLEEEAAALGGYVTVARALQSGGTDEWPDIPRSVIQRLIFGCTIWAQAGHDFDVQIPQAVASRSALARFNRLRLSQTLFWALGGVLSHESEESAL